jgi:hypothetical protein
MSVSPTRPLSPRLLMRGTVFVAAGMLAAAALTACGNDDSASAQWEALIEATQDEDGTVWYRDIDVDAMLKLVPEEFIPEDVAAWDSISLSPQPASAAFSHWPTFSGGVGLFARSSTRLGDEEFNELLAEFEAGLADTRWDVSKEDAVPGVEQAGTLYRLVQGGEEWVVVITRDPPTTFVIWAPIDG